MDAHASLIEEFRPQYYTRQWFKLFKNKTSLLDSDATRCIGAWENLLREPSIGHAKMSGGLNLHPTSNHYPKDESTLWSIRASQSLRVIVAIDEKEKSIMACYGGHHDNAYGYAERRNHMLRPRSDSLDKWREAHPEYRSATLRSSELGVPQEDDISIPITKSDSTGELSLDSELPEWMLFPLPGQMAIARDTFSGPVKLSGPPGTGKTVIALQRLAYLAKLYPSHRILFTTYSKTITQYMSDLYQLLPDAQQENVYFINVDDIVSEVANYERVPQSEQIDKIWKDVFDNHLASNPTLQGISGSWIRDEIELVIMGNDFPHENAYAMAERPGRVDLSETDLSTIWNLYVSYQAALSASNTINFPQLRALARDKLDDGEPKYRAVVVDEGQDLTPVAISVLARLLGDHLEQENSFFFSEDRSQRFMASGIDYSRTGVNFQDREIHLIDNFRTSAAISEAAKSVLRFNTQEDNPDHHGKYIVGAPWLPDDASDDIGRALSSNSLYDGTAEIPMFIKCKSEAEEIDVLISQINQLRENPRDDPEINVGVIVHRRELRDQVSIRLNESALPATSITDNEGVSFDTINVVTLERSKGLEFDTVFVLGLGKSRFPAMSGAVGEVTNLGLASHAHMYQYRQQINRLIVAMTRARNSLCLIGTGDPCYEIAETINKNLISSGVVEKTVR